jgi:hypothetical protein
MADKNDSVQSKYCVPECMPMQIEAGGVSQDNKAANISAAFLPRISPSLNFLSLLILTIRRSQPKCCATSAAALLSAMTAGWP